MIKPKTPLIILSAGGSGGHVFPALALHKELQKRRLKTHFITDIRGMQWFPTDQNLNISVTQASAIHAGLIGKLKSGLKISFGTLKSLIILLRLKPNAIVGFGGYPSFPALMAAKILNIPIILHEQNAIFGRANRAVARWTKKIATSFPETLKIPTNLQNRVVLTGNLLQEKIIAASNTPYPERKKNEPFHLMVLGGSQGARIFDDVIDKTVALLPNDMRKNLIITQQCLADNIARVQHAYEKMNIQATVAPFIKDYIDSAQKAHLIITRAGASSVTMSAALGKPTIYVPLAISLDGDQAQNAKNMVNAGGGWIVNENTLSADILSTKLQELINGPTTLKQAAKQAKTLSQLEATQKLADLIEPYLK